MENFKRNILENTKSKIYAIIFLICELQMQNIPVI